jgi:hypothetical protein
MRASTRSSWAVAWRRRSSQQEAVTVLGRKAHKKHTPIHVETTHERYGAFTFSVSFFGWLIAVALTEPDPVLRTRVVW